MTATHAKFEACMRQALSELERRHGLGETAVCESILADFPEIREHRDSVLELIYFEFVLSQDSGSPISEDELQRRFPEYQADLQKVLSVDRAFRNPSDTDTASSQTLRSESEKGFEKGEDQLAAIDGFGDYDLLEIIGQGGMGVVYKARQRRLNRFVAVKTIDAMSSLNPAAVARFRSEAELVAKLQHPNIVHVHEVGSRLGVPYFSMELVTGGTLAGATQERPLVPATAAKIVETLARAVHYAHSQSIVHRDLKPANILLSPSDRSEAIELPIDTDRATLASVGESSRFEPKIADFGLAKYLEGALDRTATKAMIGTPSYMAPELIDSTLGAVGPACDIYSLGAILYDALVGRPPFNAATVIETLKQVLNSEVIPPSKLQAKIPRDLETICLKCLKKEPTKRYESADDLADDLQRFLAGHAILARPAGLLEHSWKWARRHPSLAALIAAVMVASISITFLWLKSEQSRVAEHEALKRNEQLLYDRDIALAQFEYQSNRVERSREILEKTRTEYRGWEWKYLDQQTNQAIWESPKLRNQIVAASISHDGKFVAAVSNDLNEPIPESIHVWDIAKNELKWKLDGSTAADLHDVQFSPDGAWLLTAAISRSKGAKTGVKLWDLSNGTLIRNVSDSNAAVARFSRDGKSIFAGDMSGLVSQYSTETGKVVRKYRAESGSGKEILDMDFNPDGSRMLVSSNSPDVTLWDTWTGKKLQRLARESAAHRVAWSPDGSTVSLSHFSGMRRLYKVDAGLLKLVDEQRNNSQSHGSFTYGRFTPDGRRFVSAVFGNSIEIRDVSTGFLEQSLPAHNGHTRTIAFDASGRYLVTGGSDNRVRVWDLAVTGRHPNQTPVSRCRVREFVISPSSKEMALGLYRHVTGKPRIEIRDVRTHKLVKELIGHSNWLTCVAYSADGNQLVSGSLDKTVRVWDPISGEQLAVFEGHKAPITGVAFSKDTRFATSIDKTGVLVVWNLSSKSLERSYNLDATIQSVSFHPLRPLMAVACEEKGVALWDTQLGTQITQLPMDGDFTGVCFSPDGRRLATTRSKPSMLVWRTDDLLVEKSPKPICELNGNSDTINYVSFSPDGKRLVSSCRDESFRVYDVECGYELLTLESGRGTDGLVRFSPDGKTIVRILGGIFSTWTIDHANPAGSLGSALPSNIAWHQSEAAAATKSQKWFAAQFHQNYLTKLEPDKVAHFVNRASSRILLGDFAGAEEDLCQCDGKMDATAQMRVFLDLARVYLSQEKWTEFREICSRLSHAVHDSNNPTELNNYLWYSVLGSDSTADTLDSKQRLQALVTNPKLRKSEYLNTLALSHYRDYAYRDAIQSAQESIKLLKGTPSPCDWLIIALSYAKLDQQRIGWLPRFIRTKIREWGFSSHWSTSVEYVNKVDAWMAEQTELVGANKKVPRESILLMNTELPLLKKEWDEIANSK